MRILTIIYILFSCLLALNACREDEYVTYMTDTELPSVATDSCSQISGMYVLCEGNMGSNKCTLDYLDLSGSWSGNDGKVHYLRNIYGLQNPSSVFELGDVGNDIQIYGGKLWIVVNCSNKVEICQVRDAHRIGQVNIPNARYITFYEGFAYVSSYVSQTTTLAEVPRGCVYKVDTLTLQKVDSVLVGYQPEEMAVVNHRLYVANSGGYRAPDYDHTMSIIDLTLPQMKVVETLDIAPNLHHVVASHQGHIWVTSRGDYANTPAMLHHILPSGNVQNFDLPVSNFSLAGDTLFCLCTSENTEPHIVLLNLKTQTLSTLTLQGLDFPRLVHPYGIIANPVSRDFYVMDAKNYVSSGELLHFLPDGSFDWRVQTGDIPSRAVFVSKSGGSFPPPSQPSDAEDSPYIAGIDEYVPAPGQFVNTLPLYEAGDDVAKMAQKCFEAIGKNRKGLVSLGSFGGYITFHFAQPVQNIKGKYDLQIFGNANVNGSEPGIVMVSVDENHNGIPDDPWYELAGSAEVDNIGEVLFGYTISYSKADDLTNIPWQDSQNNSGFVLRNPFHDNEYYPLWETENLSFSGTLLPNNGIDIKGDGRNWQLKPYRYGYVDNLPNNDKTGNKFDLSWAVDPVTRQPVSLTEVHFIRVYTALNQTCGWLGETSTEISGAEYLHFPTK